MTPKMPFFLCLKIRLFDLSFSFAWKYRAIIGEECYMLISWNIFVDGHNLQK